MVTGLLFDMDGVVIDSERYNDKACADLLQEFGKSYDREYLKPLMAGKSDVEGMDILVKHHQVPLSGANFDLRRKENKKRFYQNEIPFMDGFSDFFSQLRTTYNCPAAIVTSCNKEYFDLIDARLHISTLFDGNIFRSEMVAKHKPAPDVYLFAAKKLGISCKDSLVFEDSPSGIVSGYRAGAKVVAMTTTFSKKSIIENIKKIEPAIHVDEILFIAGFNKVALQQVISFSSHTTN